MSQVTVSGRGCYRQGVLLARIAVGGLLGLALGQAQSGLPEVTIAPEIEALLAIKAKMKRSLAEVPDYVCAETVNRIRVSAKQRRKIAAREENSRHTVLTDFADTVRLDVAVVDGAEIYSWPGAKFEAVPLGDMVGFGLMATGSFSSLAKSVFVNDQGLIRYAGREEIEGEPALRYDYRVSLFRSGFRITTQSGQALSAYEGSFWAASDDYRLLRLTRKAVEIPPELGLTAVTAQIDYADVSIDGAAFTLPKFATEELGHADGAFSRNDITFDNCRKFGAEATLSFDVADEPLSAEPTPAPAQVNVPPGTELHVELLTELRSETANVGDAIRARLRREIEIEGRTTVEKGALLLGRVRRIQSLGDEADPYVAVALEFTELQADGVSSTVKTTLIGLPGASNVARTHAPGPKIRISRRGYGWGALSGTVETTVSEWEVDQGVEGMDTFYVGGGRVRLPKGFRMTLRVE